MFLSIVLTTLLLGFGSSWAGVLLSEFYPYGAEYGDKILPNEYDHVAGPIRLMNPFPFFDRTNNVVYVSTKGIIPFGEGIPSFRTSLPDSHIPTCGPVLRIFSYIAPYWSGVDTTFSGTVSYRESRARVVLQKAERDIQAGFPSSSQIPSNMSAFIVTWDRVPIWGAWYAACSGTGARELRNTFQAVLATDRLRSYAIFYYNELKWTTMLESGGKCSGLGGMAAKAGYDTGDSRTFHSMPDSCTDDVRKLASTSNMGYDGKWILRVAYPLAACIQDYSNKLTISPASVSQHSKSILKLSSPCLERTEITNITCELLDSPPVNTSSWVDRKNGPTVFCLLPDLRSSGKLEVNLRLSDHVFTGNVEVTSPECPPLASIPNGQVQVVGHLMFDLAQFSCNPGYALQGKDTMVCGNKERNNNPAWLGDIPTCSALPPPECPALASIPNGQVKVLGHLLFDLAHFSCNPGYVLHGKDTLVCGEKEGNNNPSWLGSVPTCSPVPPPECPRVNSIPNGQVTLSGHLVSDFARFSCNSGWVIQGDDILICGNTEGNNKPAWLGNVPTCSPVPPPECLPLASILNGQLALSGRLESNLAQFSCNPGHVLVGSRELICGRTTEGTLAWLGPLPTCSPLPPPEAVICDVPANECLRPDFPDGTCITNVRLGCWVQLYCDEWIPRSRIRNGLQETITWKYEGKLLNSASGLVGQNLAGVGMLLENVTLTKAGTYECQREYAYTNSSFRSPSTVHRIHVVPFGTLSSADRVLFGKATALQEEVLSIRKTATRLNSTLVNKCQELVPVEPIQLFESLTVQEPPTVDLTAADRKEVRERIRVLYEGVKRFQSTVHKLGWSLRQCGMLRKYRKVAWSP